MITRKEYMSDTSLHHAYFLQFATEETRQIVLRYIGEGPIKASTDPHLNDIPLAKWDAIAPTIKETINQQLKGEMEPYAGQTPSGYLWSRSDGVCIAKAIAHEIRGF